MSDVLEISYRTKAWKLILIMLLVGAVAVGMGYFAAGNESGLRFFGLVTLPPLGATIFFWVIAAICGAASLSVVAALASGVTKRTHLIRLTPTDFTSPCGLFLRKTRTIPLADIQDVNVLNVNGTHILQVKSPHGTAGVNRGDIGKAAFEELTAALAARMQARGAG